MPTKVERTELMRTLAAVSKVVDTRNTIPLLSHVLLSVVHGQLTIQGTDLDIQAEGVVDAEGDLPLVAVPGRDLDGIVRRLAGSEVLLEMDGNQLIVRSGRSRFKLPTISPDGFPRLDGGKYDATLTTNLKALVDQVSFAAGVRDNMPALVGTYLHTKDGNLVVAATDGKRLARAVGDPAAEFTPVVLPPKLLPHIPAGEVQVEISTTRIQLTQGNLVITSKLIEDKYPDYSRAWPTDHEISVTVNRRDLKAAAERVALVSDESMGRGVRFEVADGAVILSVRSQTRGEASEEVAAEVSRPSVRSVGFNCGFLGEMLGQVPGETVTLSLGGKTGADIRGDEGFGAVLMYFELGSAA